MMPVIAGKITENTCFTDAADSVLRVTAYHVATMAPDSP